MTETQVAKVHAWLCRVDKIDHANRDARDAEMTALYREPDAGVLEAVVRILRLRMQRHWYLQGCSAEAMAALKRMQTSSEERFRRLARESHPAIQKTGNAG